MKIVGDGSDQTKSAAQTMPYLGGPEKGQLNFDGEEMKAMVAEVKAQGWPVSIHANGDAALDNALDAIEAVYGANPPSASTASKIAPLRGRNRSCAWPSSGFSRAF